MALWSWQSLTRGAVTALLVAATACAPTAPPLTPTSTLEPPTPSATVASDADIAARIGPSVVQVLTADGYGSGVKVDRGILTCEHVVKGNREVKVVTSGGATVSALVSRSDPTRDLALLLTEASIPSVEIDVSGSQRQGDAVLVLGYPMAAIIGGQATLTRGLLSAIREDKENNRTLIQTDAAVNPGSSGGAILNARGQLIGVVSMFIQGGEALGFGISAKTIQDFLLAPQTASTPSTRPAEPTVPPQAQLDARKVVLTANDLGSGWTILTGVSGTRLEPGDAFTSFLWSSDRLINGLLAIDSRVLVFGSNGSARAQIDQAVQQRKAGGTPIELRAPPMGDYARAKMVDLKRQVQPVYQLVCCDR